MVDEGFVPKRVNENPPWVLEKRRLTYPVGYGSIDRVFWKLLHWEEVVYFYIFYVCGRKLGMWILVFGKKEDEMFEI